MDLKSLRDEAIEATGRFFAEHHDLVPDEDSDEWEAEYRRQFALAKARHAAKRPGDAARVPNGGSDAPEVKWPELNGPPAQQRWAVSLRAERLKAIQSKELRDWLAGTWTASQDWINTRDLPLPAFLRRAEAQHADHRRQSETQAGARRAEQQSKAVAAARVQRQLEAAGITAKGLIELIDVSARTAAAPMRGKLAELEVEGRSLRVFETSSAAVLVVIENGTAGRSEYAIERDKGLVADLALFAQAQAS